MNQPLNVKTVIVPAGQNKYGCDVVRFTADYAASDLFEVCIGCYPLLQNNMKDVVVLDNARDVQRTTASCTTSPVDLRKTQGVSTIWKPRVEQDSLLDKLGTSADVCATMLPHYWEV
jgi:hypothetical protein